MDEHRSFRVRTEIGKDGIINVPINQTFDTIDILSLKLTQKNAYKLYDCGYGVVVGRVLANDGFGIPNAKLSIFVPMENSDDGRRLASLYNFSKTNDRGEDGNMYNLLPDFVDKACHQDVGSFYNKRFLLDNDDVIEVFEKYYKYTTTTNKSGDYIIYGVPTGSQLLHVDVDLSDIGILSQTPRDMMYKGFTADLFESPTKFKKDSNLNSLAQIKRQTKTVFVQPFWGDTTENETNASIVRCDINLDYKFESTCIFMGSVVTDTGDEAINKNCRTTKDSGKMSNLTTGPGMIEMIRYNERGKIEQATVKGEKLIDDNGVWCYQIPMNLDFVKTDEFGNLVPSDDPNKGVATRAKVRFRISMDEVGGDGVAKKRARYLVPNNPEIDRNGEYGGHYEFGSATDEADFRNLYWNCVYTVKSYIPRLQKTKNSTDRRFTGIKAVNRPGDNNPMPYNSLSSKMTFNYSMLCLILKLVVRIVYTINVIITPIGYAAFKVYDFLNTIAQKTGNITGFKWLGKVFCKCSNQIDDINEEIPCPPEDPDCDHETDPDYVDIDERAHICGDGETPPSGGLCYVFWEIYDSIKCGIGFGGLCDDGVTYYPGCKKEMYNVIKIDDPGASNKVDDLFNCFENKLAEENEVMSFNFSNDWINGVLYFPLWFRFIKQKRTYFFNQFETRGVDKWCDAQKTPNRKLKLYKTCSLDRKLANDSELEPLPEENIADYFYDPWYTVPEKRAVVIGYKANDFDKTNCYGYRCIKTAASCINGLPGIIKQEETIAKEYVYYYNPGTVLNVKDENGNYEYKFIKMFSTDIVLLGSLNDCDLQGIPQFFKKLSSSTYSMPPNLVLNDGVEDDRPVNPQQMDSGGINNRDKDDRDTDASPDVFVPGTEYTYQTGADWGKRGYRQCYGPDYDEIYHSDSNKQAEPAEQFADGGLFYGLTCSHVYTKPKTCINLERVCEYGVFPDISLDVPYVNGNTIEEKILIPDGYISYDDLYDNDGRTQFATMNSNNLKTRINPETGYEVYDFDVYYLDNFDGSLYNIMAQQDCKCPASTVSDELFNYFYNYTLENNNFGYSRFRYGNPINLLGFSHETNYDRLTNMVSTNGVIPFNNGFVSTKNSFYFYFGLKFGKTAIDRFFTDYFSPCETDESEHTKIDVIKQANSVCSGGDGYLLLTLAGIEMPYAINFLANEDNSHDVSVYDVNSERICFGSCPQTQINLYTQMLDPVTHIPIYLENDVYEVEIIDANGILDTFELDFSNGSISANVYPTSFIVDNTNLYSNNQTQYYTVANDVSRYTNNNGGYIEISYPFNSETNELITDYRFEILPNDQSDFPANHESVVNDLYTGYTFDTPLSQTPHDCVFDNNTTDGTFVIGVPKGGVKYKIRITELCGGHPSGNVFETVVMVGEGLPLNMTINGIDYDLIKHFVAGPTINDIVGWLEMLKIGSFLTFDENNTSEYQGAEYYIFACFLSEYATYEWMLNYLGQTAILFTPYNWPSDMCYDLNIFFNGCEIIVNGQLPPVTQDSPEYVLLVDTTSNILITVYEKVGSSYSPLSTVNDINDYYNNLTQSEQRNIITGLNNVINKRLEVSHKVRSAFYTRHDTGGIYDMEIGYSGGVPIIDHYIQYTVEDNNGFPIPARPVEFAENAVVGQKTPTIVYDETNQVPVFYSYNSITKKPFYFGIKDSQDNVVPEGFTVDTTINPPHMYSDYFEAHMIDKGLDCDYEIWAPINNFPNMYDSFESKFLSVDGFIGIVLKNGISTSLTRNPIFEECGLFTGDYIPMAFETLGVQYNEDIFTVESEPGTERVSYTDNYTPSLNNKNILCYEIKQTYNDLHIVQCYPVYDSYPQGTKFVCDDGRERLEIPVYPKFQLLIIQDDSIVTVENGSLWIHLKFIGSGGYTPNVVACFKSTSVGFQYPLASRYLHQPGQQTSHTTEIFIFQSTQNHSIYPHTNLLLWGKYNEIISGDYNFLTSSYDDNGVFSIDYEFNDVPENAHLVYAVSISGNENEHKYKYALSHMIDCTVYNASNITQNTITLTAVGSGKCTTYFEFVLIGRKLDINNEMVDVFFENFTYQNATTFTLTVTEYNDLTDIEEFWIRDVSGVRHLVQI